VEGIGDVGTDNSKGTRDVASTGGLAVVQGHVVPRAFRLALTLALALAVALLAWAFALAPSSALASTGHAFVSHLTEAGGFPLERPIGIAVDKAGNVFASAGGTGEEGGVVVYDSSGVFKTRIGVEEGGGLEGELTGIAVDETTGDVYVADASNQRLFVFKPKVKGNVEAGYESLSQWSGANTPGKAFAEVRAVAVDNSTSAGDPHKGDVYVLDAGEAAVDIFKPKPEGGEEKLEGEFLGTLEREHSGKPTLEEPNGLAVDSQTGQVYVSDGARLGGVAFTANAEFEKLIKSTKTPTKGFGTVTGIAVEEATGDVYIVDGENRAIDEFNPTVGVTGEWIGWIPPLSGVVALGESLGVAVAPSGDVYVADEQNSVIDIFGPSAPVPTVTTGKPAEIRRKTAKLTGTVKAEASEGAHYYFEYGETEAYGQKTTSTALGAGLEAKPKVLVEHLNAGATYHFRLVAEDASGVSYGGDEEFTTLAAVKEVKTLAATEIKATSAQFNGTLEPEGLATKYHFEYGETTAYGQNTPEGETSLGVGAEPVKSVATLRPNDLYHFRLVATNKEGTTVGEDMTVATPGPPIITPPSAASKKQSIEKVTHTTATINAEVAPGKLKTSYQFEYGETTSYGTKIPVTETEIGEGSAPVPITAELTGLKLATTYHFRVTATNAVATVHGPDQEFTTILIESEAAKALSSEGATLLTEINPLGTDAKYHFEYGETKASEKSTPIADAGSGSEDVQEEAQLLELHPGTTYHYRVAVEIGGETAFGPEQTFTTLTTGGAFSLPDGRAYELVSPPNKHGGFIEPIAGNAEDIQASENGNAITYDVDGPIVEGPEGNRSPEAQQVISTRGSSEWATQEIATPHSSAYGLRVGNPAEYLFFSSDLSVSMLQPFPFGLTSLAEPPLAPPASEAEKGHQEKTIYLRNDPPITPGPGEEAVYKQAQENGKTIAEEHKEATAKPGYVPLVTAANTAPGTKFGGTVEGAALKPDLITLGATPDLSHVVLVSDLTGLTPSGAPGLYEWSAGSLKLISILPSGTAAPHETEGAETDLGFGRRNGTGAVRRDAISNNGTRIFWTEAERPGTNVGGEFGHLYMRDTAKEATLQIDAPHGVAAESEEGNAQFQAATSDGSRVFFTDTQDLLPEATAAPGKLGLPGKRDLYECHVVEEEPSGELVCELSDLTVDHNLGESANVRGAVLGIDEETGSYAYFVATGVLAEGGQSGADNLYVAHREGSTWTTKFIRDLSSEDTPDYEPRGTVNPVRTPVRVSPNGRYLAFMSNRRLTGYDNTDVNEEMVKGKPVHHADEEVFLYDAKEASVTCVSCNPSGARPRGAYDTAAAGEGQGLVVDRSHVWMAELAKGVDHNPTAAHWLAGSLPGWTALGLRESLYQSRYLNNEGRLFFNSADPLVPRARELTRTEKVGEGEEEKTVGVENVYEYEPTGMGSCASASGCVALISSATSAKESAFLDATPSGNDVFILTAAALVPQDVDSNYDVYDARVCGEAGCETPKPPPPAQCTKTEECRPGSFEAPSFVSPPSSSLAGSGNEQATITNRVPPPKGGGGPKPKTSAELLAAALKVCHKLPNHTHAQKKKRAACEASAKKKYGAKKAAKKSAKKSATKARRASRSRGRTGR